jgi:hypothetical protein
MLSALIETAGALGVLASIAVKVAELRNAYRRRAEQRLRCVPRRESTRP